MARSPRGEIPGGVYHVTARGNRRQAIFLGDDDYAYFLRLATDVVTRLRWRWHAYCLLPNHYHLVIETPKGNLSAGMHRLNGVYAQWFNRRHDVDGHLFQDRFHCVAVEVTWHLLELARYVALNPVRAGLCGHPSEWRWSSYTATVGTARRSPVLETKWLLSQFGTTPARARERFIAFVHEGAT